MGNDVKDVRDAVDASSRAVGEKVNSLEDRMSGLEHSMKEVLSLLRSKKFD